MWFNNLLTPTLTRLYKKLGSLKLVFFESIKYWDKENWNVENYSWFAEDDLEKM